MTELKTKSALLRALREARGNIPVADELRRQRISFIMGTVKDSEALTRARVEEVLAEQEGKQRDPV